MRVGVGSEILAPDIQAVIAPIDGSGMGEGYQGWESYQYDDEHHPLHPSLYQSGGSVGHAALHFTYRSDNTTGKLGSVTRSPFMEASSCRPQCSSQTYCCTNAASSSSGWCSDMPCQKMGHTWAYSYVGDNAVAVEIDGMPMQHFAYSSSEALTSIEQKVSIANNTKQVKMLDIEYYKNGNVKDLLAFVAYPWVPEP